MSITSKITEIKYNRAKDSQDKFLSAFGDVIRSGKTDEFESYRNTFLSVTESVWKTRNEEKSFYPLEKYKKNVKTLIDIATGSTNKNSMIMMLQLLEAVYGRLVSCVREEGIKAADASIRSNRNGANLFNTRDFFDLVRPLDISSLENTVNISNLLYNVNLVDMALYYDPSPAKLCKSSTKKPDGVLAADGVKDGMKDSESTPLHWVSTATVIDIQALLGQYIAEQRRKGNMPSMEYWCKEFRLWIGADRERAVDESLREFFTSAVASAGTMYTCGLIAEGCFDIVDEGLYRQRLSTLLLISDIEKRVVAAVHAFLYYMLYWEDSEYVGKELKEGAEKFWPAVAGTYKRFIDRYESDIETLLIDDLNSEWHFRTVDGKDDRVPDSKSQWIYYLLRRFDFRMRNRRHGGVLVLSEAVEGYCLFTIVYMKRYGFRGSPFGWMTDENHSVEHFTKYINKDDNKSVRKRIHEFAEFMTTDTSDGPVSRTDVASGARSVTKNTLFRNIYEGITVGISALYKEQKVKEAREKEAEYLKNKDKIDSKATCWQESILKTIVGAFGEDIDTFGSGGSDNVSYRSVHLLQYTDRKSVV